MTQHILSLTFLCATICTNVCFILRETAKEYFKSFTGSLTSKLISDEMALNHCLSVYLNQKIIFGLRWEMKMVVVTLPYVRYNVVLLFIRLFCTFSINCRHREEKGKWEGCEHKSFPLEDESKKLGSFHLLFIFYVRRGFGFCFSSAKVIETNV